MVGVSKIQRGNAGYWINAVAEGADDYYTKPGEAPGEWIGSLAAELGLSGRVDPESYAAALDGRDPLTDTQLLSRPETQYRRRPDGSERRIEAVLGYDVRFSAPKSVSILYALGEEATRERVVAILGEAVAQGISHLEREACFVQRTEDGEKITEPGEGFVGMAFRHRMSRAGDPALHVHVVVSNMTRTTQREEDGQPLESPTVRWQSLASPKGRQPLWLHGKSAGVVFQAALRAGFLREFGLDFCDVRNGYADLRGFPREVIDALSTRSKEIAEWLERHGAASPEAAQVAAYRTREAKDYGVDEDERRAEWIEAAEPYGITPDSVAARVTAGAPREPRQITDRDLDAALAQLEAASTHFDTREVLWALCDQLPEGASREELSGAVDRLLASERVVCLHSSEDPFDPDYFTTPRLAALEKRFTDAALEGAEAGVGVAPPETVAVVLAEHDYLGADQREMVVRLTTSGEQIVPVAAWPGTGKTTALEAAREIWEAAGFPVIGCATAKTASGEMRDAGILNSDTIAKLLMRADELRIGGVMPLEWGTVIVLDEATMTSTDDIEALRLLAVECGGKLVLIGDPNQIGAIGPGGIYAHLTRLVEPATLTTIRRQRRPTDQRLVSLVYEGRGSEALDLLRTESRVIVGDDLKATLDAMLADWHRDYASGADVVMVARRNRDVDCLNDSARELRRAEDALGENEVIVGERPFAAGDRVQTRINRDGVANRERWDVLAVDPAARTVELRRLGGDGRVIALGPDYLDRPRRDNGPSLEYAYALTKYGAQGKTVDRAYPLLDGGGSLEQELVALTRGREVSNVYAVASSALTDADLGPGRRALSDPLHDVRVTIEREGNDFAASEVALRKELLRLAPAALAERRAKLLKAARAADPVLSRRDDLDRKVADATNWLLALAREREAIEAMQAPPAAELARVGGAEARVAEELRRARRELAALPAPAPGTEHPLSPKPQARLEAVLIEKRIDTLVRRDMEAARLDNQDVIYDALGPFPHSDPELGVAWHEGAHAALTYRHRYGIEDPGSALGEPPVDATARAERASAERRLQDAQRRLGREAERSAEHDFGIERAIGF